MSKARSPRGVDSMTMGTRPDIVVWEDGDDDDEEEKGGDLNDDEDDDDVEVKGRRRLKLDDEDVIDGIVDFSDDEALALSASTPLGDPAAAAIRAASSTMPRRRVIIASCGEGQRSRKKGFSGSSMFGRGRRQ